MVTSELIVDFVNTVGLEPPRDDLPTPAALVTWLSAQGLEPGARVTKAQLAHAHALRTALRDLLLAHNEVPVDVAAATGVLDAAARRAGLGLRFVEDGAHAEPTAAGVAGALGRILAAVAEAMTDGTWERLKVCRADDCNYAFLDSAKNRSRAWCSMQSCGNRAKVAAYRERHPA